MADDMRTLVHDLRERLVAARLVDELRERLARGPRRAARESARDASTPTAASCWSATGSTGCSTRAARSSS